MPVRLLQRKSDEDLFRESTMSFGEHLEELRRCLFRALIGLVVCFLIGLWIGGPVVDQIQRPLRNALIDYYTTKSEKTVQQHMAELELRGYGRDIVDQVSQRRMLPEELYINPTELLGQLKIALPEGHAGANPGKTELVPVMVWRPLEKDKRVRASSLNAHEAFAIYIKAALLVGLILASPWIFYQIWTFVAAGLYRHERRFVYTFLPFSLALFLGGAALAFFFVFEPVLKFLFSFNSWLNIDPDPRISEWLGFVLMLPLGFGIAFQLPLVMLFLERIGVFSVDAYLAKWRIAILVIFTMAMMLTPPDPWSMMLMAMPLTGIYFGGILLCLWVPRRKSPFDSPDQ